MKKLWLLASLPVIILIIGLACNAIGIGNQNSEDTNPSPAPSQQRNTPPVEQPSTFPSATPQLPTNQDVSTAEVTGQGVCQSDKWKIIPERVLSFPSDNGFKYIVIPYVIKNETPYWSRFQLYVIDSITNWTVTTEDGFIYNNGGTVEDSLQSIYESYGDLNILGNNSVWASLPEETPSSLVYYPPGFVFRAHNLDINIDAWAFPQMVFRVAETQNQFIVTIPSLTVQCIHDDGQAFKESLGPLGINLTTDIQQVPKTELPLLDHKDINTPIILEEIGKLEYQDIKLGNPNENECLQENVCLIKVIYRFTNASTGYETKLGLRDLYLIGDDGIVRHQYGWVETSVGPGQSINIEILFHPGPNTNKLMMIWTLSNPYQIIDLPSVRQ